MFNGVSAGSHGASPAPRPTAWIVEDHPVMCAALRELLTDLMDVTASAASPRSLLMTDGPDPDVLLLDVYIGGKPILSELPTLQKRFPTSLIVLITGQPTVSVLEQGMHLGVAGILDKSENALDLQRALRLILQGERYFSPSIVDLLLDQPAEKDETPHSEGTKPTWDHFTAREQDVLELVAFRRTPDEIAALLHLSVHTVRAHLRNIHSKLGVNRYLDVALHARRMLDDRERAQR